MRYCPFCELTPSRSDQQLVIDDDNPLTEHLFDIAADQAAKNNLVFCLHTGYWCDFRKLDPPISIPFVARHKDTRFDVYHAGYPYVWQAIMLGKGILNVWLNMCWTYIISQKIAEDALDEMLEMVPVNKQLGFGSDYSVVEKVYGHLTMASESIARVLALKIIR